MALILNDVLSEKISIDDFKTWLTSDSNDKADFILYFLNFVKENCSWLISKNGKGIESPTKSVRSNQQISTDNNSDNKQHYSQSLHKKNPITDHSARKRLSFNQQRHIKNTNTRGKNRNDQLVPDITSLDAFPPVGCKNEISTDYKSKRRITPTPVQEIQKGSSKFGNPRFVAQKDNAPSEFSKPAPIVEMPSSDLKKEREMLKLTRRQISNPGSLSHDFSNLKIESSISPLKSVAVNFVTPDPKEVTHCDKLEKFSNIYSILISYTFVPNVTSELYFIFEIITSTVLPGEKSNKKDCVFHSIHNCVFFAVSVLNKLKWLLRLLDSCTLQSLKEIPFLAIFSSPLIEYLQLCCNDIEESPTKSQSVNRVPFILEEDSIENFLDSHAFTSFRKQRDLFYELLRDWQQQPFDAADSRFKDSFSRKAKNLINISPNSINLHHLAKLIQNQMIASCLGLEVTETYDELLSNVEKNFPGKIEKLRQRFMMPYFIGGASPTPSFYGAQVFFSELIQAASSTTLIQHLQDIFCTKILELNNTDIFYAESSSMLTLRDEYAFVLHTLRLLGKFLGFLHFLPYKTSEPVSTNILNQQLVFRKNSVPLIHTSSLLKSALEKQRLILTVPWIIEYLSMIDTVAKNLPYINETMEILNAIYHEKYFFETDSYNFWFLRIMIGWLFDVLCYPVKCSSLALPVIVGTCQNKGLDSLIIVNQQLIHACCPYLVEFKILVYSFLNGIRKGKKKEVRKITPLSTTKLSSAKSFEQEIQSQLEENFFFLQPPSLKKTVDFVSERMASRFIQKIRSEVTNFKLQTVESIINNEEYKGFLESSPSKKKKEFFIDTYIFNMYETSQSRVNELIQTECHKDIECVLPLLLSVDIKPSVLKMASDITFRLAHEKISVWCNANLIFKDINQDIKNKINHISKGDSENISDDDFNLTLVLNSLRNGIFQNLSGVDDHFVDYPLLLFEVFSLMNKPIVSSTKKLLVFLVIDLYVSILVNAPQSCMIDFDKNFITVLCECPQNLNLEIYFLGSHNIKLLIKGKNIESICKKMDNIISELVNKKVFCFEQLKGCLKNLKLCEWHSSNANIILESLSYTILKFDSTEKDNKS